MLVKKLTVTIALVGISLLVFASPMRAFAQTAPILPSCTGSGTSISCTIHEGSPLTLPTTTRVFGTLQFIVMCEPSDCPNTEPLNFQAQDVSDLLGIHTTCVNNQCETQVGMLSDTNSEGTSSTWCDQENPSCTDLGSGNNLGSILDANVATLPEGSGTADAASLIPGSATEKFVHFYLVSDSSALPENPETPIGVPEFGLPAVVIAAVGILAIYLLRNRSMQVPKLM